VSGIVVRSIIDVVTLEQGLGGWHFDKQLMFLLLHGQNLVEICLVGENHK